jgi:phenylacetate-CoA ligase
VNVYPSLIEEIVRAYPEVVEYRVQLNCRGALAELSLEVEAGSDGGAAASLPARLEDSIQQALNLRMPVRLLAPGSLPRFEMKAHRWIKTAE